MQLSTVVSDIIYTASSFFAATKLRERKAGAALGFSFLGLAGSVGVLRFAGVPYLEWFHRRLSLIAGHVGYPLILLALILDREGDHHGPLTYLDYECTNYAGMLTAASLVAQVLLPESWINIYSAIIILPLTIVSLAKGGLARNWRAVGATTAFFVFSGVGAEGNIGSIPRADIFHFGLAFAHVLFVKSFKR